MFFGEITRKTNENLQGLEGQKNPYSRTLKFSVFRELISHKEIAIPSLALWLALTLEEKKTLARAMGEKRRRWHFLFLSFISLFLGKRKCRRLLKK